jgi:parvulin-like peptidyl-prolyl isomerase
MKMRVVILAAILWSTGIAANAQLANAIRAVVHDAAITSQEVEIPTLPLIQDLRRRYAGQQQEYEKQLAATLERSLEERVEWQLILHEFSSGGYKYPESVVDEELARRLRSDFGGERSRMIKTLQAEGLTYEKYREQVRERMIVRALRERHISHEVMISPYKIETYYLANQDKFKVEDRVKLRMIVLKAATPEEKERARKIADEIVTKIKEGAAFSEMADTYSSGGKPGGDFGWADRTTLRKELVDAAFALAPGELSNVIEAPDACFLMLLEEKKSSHVKALSEVRDEIERNMINEERERLQKKWLDRLRKKTFVRYF